MAQISELQNALIRGLFGSTQLGGDACPFLVLKVLLYD